MNGFLLDSKQDRRIAPSNGFLTDVIYLPGYILERHQFAVFIQGFGNVPGILATHVGVAAGGGHGLHGSAIAKIHHVTRSR